MTALLITEKETLWFLATDSNEVREAAAKYPQVTNSFFTFFFPIYFLRNLLQVIFYQQNITGDNHYFTTENKFARVVDRYQHSSKEIDNFCQILLIFCWPMLFTKKFPVICSLNVTMLLWRLLLPLVMLPRDGKQQVSPFAPSLFGLLVAWRELSSIFFEPLFRYPNKNPYLVSGYANTCYRKVSPEPCFHYWGAVKNMWCYDRCAFWDEWEGEKEGKGVIIFLVHTCVNSAMQFYYVLCWRLQSRKVQILSATVTVTIMPCCWLSAFVLVQTFGCYLLCCQK